MYDMGIIERAINFIESRLEEDIGLTEVASFVGFSQYHFHRMFQSVAGDSVTSYIRRRRLIRAACDIVNTDRRILDIALDYCFESQETFTRAFTRVYGTTPGRYRKSLEGMTLIDKGPVNFDSIKNNNGGIVMEPKIVFKDELKVIGMRYYGENNNMEIPGVWEKFMPRMKEIKHVSPSGESFGICSYTPNPKEDYSFEYIACLLVDSLEDIPEGMEGRTFPASKYAVFTHKGSLYDGEINKLKELYDFAYNKWLPSSGYEPAACYDFEYYTDKFTGPFDAESELDIYIPIK